MVALLIRAFWVITSLAEPGVRTKEERVADTSEPREDGLIYHFENGEVGVQWEFALKDGVVVSIEKILMD